MLAAADLVTLARTGVEYDYRGDVIDAHAPEMPTRFAKELTQIIRGAVAIGIPSRSVAAGDPVRPRLNATTKAHAHRRPGRPSRQQRYRRAQRINKPRATVDRQLQALHMLDVLDVAEEDAEYNGKPVTRWFYTIAPSIDPTALDPKKCPEMSPPTPRPPEKGEETASNRNRPSTPTDISGHGQPPSETPPTKDGWYTCRTEGCTTGLYNPETRQTGYCTKCREENAA